MCAAADQDEFRPRLLEVARIAFDIGVLVGRRRESDQIGGSLTDSGQKLLPAHLTLQIDQGSLMAGGL